MTWRLLVGATLTAFALATDAFSLALFIRRCRRGYGASGVAVIPLVIYGMGIGLLPLDRGLRAGLGVGAFVLHMAVSIVVPLLYWRRRRLREQREEVRPAERSPGADGNEH